MPKPYTIQTQHQSGERDVLKHLDQHSVAFQHPIADHQRIFFKRIQQHPMWRQGVHVDWGCGTGMSTLNISQTKPQQLIVGIDQSKQRLMKLAWAHEQIEMEGFAQHQNCILIHGRIEDMALLFFEYSIEHQAPCVQAQTFFYPNPWPKRKHLNKRLPTHPIFPYLMRLSPHIVMRCNWQTYAAQWHFCAKHLRPDLHHTMARHTPIDPISLFERKYLETKTPCFEVVCHPNTPG